MPSISSVAILSLKRKCHPERSAVERSVVRHAPVSVLYVSQQQQRIDSIHQNEEDRESTQQVDAINATLAAAADSRLAKGHVAALSNMAFA
jgi:translation elongation factor EF-1alpha